MLKKGRANRGPVKLVLFIAVGSLALLSGCSAPNLDVDSSEETRMSGEVESGAVQDSSNNRDMNANTEEGQPQTERLHEDEQDIGPSSGTDAGRNFLLEKCDSYTPSGSGDWKSVHDLIIADMCTVTQVDETTVDFVFGPSVSTENVNVQKYMETAYFSHTYWQQFIPEEYPKWTFVIASAEDDHQWWEDNHDKYIKSEYKSELDGCTYYSENKFCSAKYSPDEGKSNIPGLVSLWSLDPNAPELRNDTVLDPGHNGPHWYQDAHGYTHWYELLIEGHATLYEISTHMLAGDEGRQREDFAWLAYSADENKMTAETAAEFRDYFDVCWGQGYKCNHFYYGGGAMFHEKLILDYGYEEYMEWHVRLREVDSTSEFNQLFVDHFGLSVDEFADGPFAEYVVGQFVQYRSQQTWQ